MSVHISCNCNSYLTDVQILMKLYIVAVYYLNICMAENNPGTNYFITVFLVITIGRCGNFVVKFCFCHICSAV